jgi:plasmid stabilization system protein ParE
MTYQVELSSRAEADLDRLLTTTGEASPKAYRRLARNFWQAVKRVRTYPLACGLAYEKRYFSEELRHLLFFVNPRRKYRALFFVRGNVVHVLCIRAPGEKPVRPKDIKE